MLFSAREQQGQLVENICFTNKWYIFDDFDDLKAHDDCCIASNNCRSLTEF